MGRSALIGVCAAAAVLLCAGVFTWKWLSQPSGQLVPSLPTAPETSKGILSVQDLPLKSKTFVGSRKDDYFPLPMTSALEVELTETFNFLASYAPKGEDIQKFNARKDACLRELDDRVTTLPNIVDRVILLMENKDAELVGRDYAAQHAVAMYKTMAQAHVTWSEGGQASRLRSVLMAMLEERLSTLAGTSLLTLRTLASCYPKDFDQTRLVSKALEIVEDKEASVLSRTTALRVASEAGDSRVLPQARVWVEEGGTSTLRIAAIAVIGELGDQTDYEWLREKRANSPYWFHPAIDRSLNMLEKRI